MKGFWKVWAPAMVLAILIVIGVGSKIFDASSCHEDGGVWIGGMSRMSDCVANTEQGLKQ